MSLRVLFSPALDGASNMAIDHALMESVADGHAPVTLRLYAWSPPCLSLGYGQSLKDVDFPRLKQRAWDLVRRPTGGRAILHADELTYSLTFSQNSPLAEGDILTSYRRLSAILQTALEEIGVKTETAPKPDPGEAQAVCFVSPGAYEITVGGKKLIGSAQVRRQKAVLQHGSIPLKGDLTRICDVLAYPDENQRRASRLQVQASATTLEAALGRPVSWETVADSLTRAFSALLGSAVYDDTLTPRESLRVEQLKYEVYASDAWLNKR
jgi:lipoate-protein ligase A